MAVDEPLRKYGPLNSEHPLLGEECVACQGTFKAGDYTTLVAVGPGDSPLARERARQGLPYTAAAVVVHYACATGAE